jgi:Family of unknown function (DUF6134)
VGMVRIISGGECKAAAAKSRKNARNHLLPRVFGACLAALLFAGPHAALAAQYRLDYRVSHSLYGDIGTYSNVIETDGDTTTVTSALDVKVSILGVVGYRRDARRVETWMGDRLLDFHGTSHLNGKTIVLRGSARGDEFVIITPNGEVSAPASIRVANPWTTNTLNGDTILLPDEGVIKKTRLTDAGETSVTIRGRNVRVREYDIGLIGAAKHYQVWFDATNTPVMFRVFDSDGICTFTLNGAKLHNMLLAERARNPQQGTP